MSNWILGYVVTKNGCASGLSYGKFLPASGILSSDVKGFTLFESIDKACRAIVRTQKYTKTIEPEFDFVEDKWNALPVCGDKKPRKKKERHETNKPQSGKRKEESVEPALC